MSNNVNGSLVVYINEEYRSVGMGSNTVSVSPCGVGAISAGLGLGAGYIFAPGKYSLERILMQDDKTLDQIFSSQNMKNATPGEKQSVLNLKEAAHEYRRSGQEITKEKIAPATNAWQEMVKQVNVDDKFVKEAARKKHSYKQALKDANYRQLKDKLEAAQKSVVANPKDTNI